MIADATVLICLSKIKRLDLLKTIYKKIMILPAVEKEVLIEDKEGYRSIYNEIKSGRIEVMHPKKIIKLGLGAGEEHAINLAIERKDSIILDDAFAIKAAKALNVDYIRTTTVIFTALKKNIVTKKQALSILNQLIENSYYISTRDYAILVSRLK